MKAGYLELDKTNDIFYYALPENIKKCCFSIENFLGKYFVENIATARYLVFQKFKITCKSKWLILALEKCSNYPSFDSIHYLDAFIKNDFSSKKELFVLMFFLITVMDRFTMINQSRKSLRIRDDIFFLFGLMQLRFREKNDFWNYNILSKFFIKVLTKKYCKEAGFGSGIITLLELDYFLAESSKEICTFGLRKYCFTWMDIIIFSLNEYLQNNFIRSQSALSNRELICTTAKCQITAVDDLEKSSSQKHQINNSINGIIYIYL
jgi:hypothetical protein